MQYLFDAILSGALRKKRDEYLPSFSAHCVEINAQRTKLKASELNTELKSQGFWTQIQGQNTIVNFGQVPSGTPAANVLGYTGEIMYVATDAVQQRSFWALPSTWPLLVKACQLMSQSGFHVYITAVNNPYHGRHPPHLTHRDGREIDLIWTFTTDPADTVKNLAQSRLIPGETFFDVATQRVFDVQPVSPQRHFESVSHTGLAQLATCVALQAIALAGFERYLYLDFKNMKVAAADLALVLGPNLDPFSGGRGPVPVFEGMSHFNHLHIEAPGPRIKVTNYFVREVLTKLYYLALLRDKDEDFLNVMFQPPDLDLRKVQATPKEIEKAREFQDRWTNSSKNMQPSLLPVWLPRDVRDRLRQGEKIEGILGIGI
jgi:hypothetical protein